MSLPSPGRPFSGTGILPVQAAPRGRAPGQAGRLSHVGLYCLVVAAGWSLTTFPSPAAEVHSNGAGGGLWSDPLTWRTQAVPATNDVVTVAGDDHVVVDLTDPDRIACQQLSIDPRGMLSFKRDHGRVILNVDGAVECYGALRMDMTHAGEDRAELRLAAAAKPERLLRLRRGGSLVLGGRPEPADGAASVLLVAGPLPATNAPAGDPSGRLLAEDGTLVDLVRAELRHVQVSATGLDNTGASANERISVRECRFRGRSNLRLHGCDTPLVADNEFTCEKSPGNAIYVYGGALAELRGNTIRGPYDYGINTHAANLIVLSNTVEGAGTGFHGYGQNLMLKQHVSRRCRTGYHFVNAVTGVAEEIVADACRRSFFVQNIRNMQWISCRTTNLAPGAVALAVQNSELAWLNCQIPTDAVDFSRPFPAGPTVSAWDYLVVRVTGQVPAGSQVAVSTADPDKPVPPGALDPNVRGSPAALRPDGWTPLPATLAALVVRSWSLTHENERLPTPAYRVRVLGPAPQPDAEPPVLKEVRAQPGADWYRPDPNARKPTLEVTVP